jgi:hypothetical protein
MAKKSKQEENKIPEQVLKTLAQEAATLRAQGWAHLALETEQKIGRIKRRLEREAVAKALA